MVGLPISCSQREASITWRSSVARRSLDFAASASAVSAMRLTSPPAQKAPPAPVSTTTRTSSSAASRVRAETSAASIGRDMALRRSGRLSVSQATPFSMRSSSSDMGFLHQPGRRCWPAGHDDFQRCACQSLARRRGTGHAAATRVRHAEYDCIHSDAVTVLLNRSAIIIES